MYYLLPQISPIYECRCIVKETDMAKTQAERAKAYRAKKRAIERVGVTMTGLECDENVTESKRDAPFVTEADPPCVETVPESSESTPSPNAKESVMYEVKPTLCEFVDVEAHLESIDCVVLRLLDKSLKD